MSILLVLPLFALTALGAIPSSDLACWSSHTSWSLLTSSINAAPSASRSIITNSSSVVTRTGYYTPITYRPDTTLCDGYPRLTGRQTPTGTYPTTVVTVSTTSTWMPPSPKCTIQNYGSVCISMHSSFSSMITQTPTPTQNTYYLKPPCTTPDALPKDPAITCMLEYTSLTYQVLYWPTTTIPYNCATGTTTTIPTPEIRNPPPTATYKGLTMTYPTIYYILDNLEIKTYAGLVNMGRNQAWLPFPTSSTSTAAITLSQDPLKTPVSSALISCNLGRMCYTTLQPFAFNHLATAPADKYSTLRGGVSETIYQGLYRPYYTLVPEISKGKSEWEKCASMVTATHHPTYIAITTG